LGSRDNVLKDPGNHHPLCAFAGHEPPTHDAPTVHPSSILRMPDQTARHAAFAALVKDLKAAVEQVAA